MQARFWMGIFCKKAEKLIKPTTKNLAGLLVPLLMSHDHKFNQFKIINKN